MKPTLVLTAALLMLLSGCPTGDDDDDDDASGECDPLGGDLSPTITIDDPDNVLMLGPNDPINWVIRVEDEDGDVEAVLLDAYDLSDGTPDLLDYEPPSPNSDGRATFGMPGGTLGTGVLTIRMRATDEQGCTADDSVVLCIDVSDTECPSR
ncbi:MAG: hypothetical protein GY898_13670 [Proteobacteria bacterium]|nr:hypothetical protein [Pseudomonadota bacterium]